MIGLQMHLFDIDIPGKISFKESDTLTAGENIAVVDTEAGRLGLGICYDIRFPELAMIYARQGVQLILYPGRGLWPLCMSFAAGLTLHSAYLPVFVLIRPPAFSLEGMRPGDHLSHTQKAPSNWA